MQDTPKKQIPQATIKRLATYVQVLEKFDREKVEIISSEPLAAACGVQGSQLRKDLAYFGEFGIRGLGYPVKGLMQAITTSLGVDHEWSMILIGVGNLGRAMINHIGFHSKNFVIKAIFDCDPFKIGETVYGLEVRCTEDIKKVVQNMQIMIGIITTPPERAQRAADHLINAGLTSILNFAPARIQVPETVQVEYVDFFNQMYSLAFNQTQQWKKNAF